MLLIEFIMSRTLLVAVAQSMLSVIKICFFAFFEK